MLKLKLSQLKTPKFLTVGSILFCIFLLAGGLGTVHVYLFGARTYSEYIFSVTAPFFAGFVFVGFLGLWSAYKNRCSSRCLYGLLVVVCAYFCIEVLVNAVGV